MTTPDNPYELLSRFDGADMTVLVIKQHQTAGYWTLISKSDGEDWLVRPNGAYVDASHVDSRDDTDAGRLFAWLGDLEW